MDDVSLCTVRLVIRIIIIYSTATKAANVASNDQADWYTARKRCSLATFFGKDSQVETVVENLHHEHVAPIASRMPPILWTGGTEVFTPWIRAEGCYRANIGSRNTTNQRFQFRNNQASVCAAACKTGLFIRVYGKVCECFVSRFNEPQISPELCDTKCPGSPSEMCGGNQTITVYSYRSLLQENERSVYTCAAVVHNGRKWAARETNCTRNLPYLYREMNQGKYFGIEQKRMTWAEMRNSVIAKSRFVFRDIDYFNTNANNLDLTEFYWIGIFRNTSVLWDNIGEGTGQCVALKGQTFMDWDLVMRDCDDSLRYICDTTGESAASTTHSQQPPHTDGAPSGATTTDTTTRKQPAETLLGIDEQLYVYIVIGVGSAVFVTFLFVCGIMIRKCMRTKPNNNNAEVTKTSVISTSEWMDNSTGGYDETDDSGNDPAEEHIYNEIVDVEVDVIRINNYSEPLPLKEPVREYSTPYDAIKVKTGIKKIKRKRTKNYSSIEPSKHGKPKQGAAICDSGQEAGTSGATTDNSHYHVCNIEVHEKGRESGKTEDGTPKSDITSNTSVYL